MKKMGTAVFLTGTFFLSALTAKADEVLPSMVSTMEDSVSSAEGIWKKEADRWYYPDAQGQNQSGWKKIDERWYYFHPEDGFMEIEWQKIDGNWYYFNPKEGFMETEWEQIDGDWYYFNPKEGFMETGWNLIEDSWYYFNPFDGTMETGWFSASSPSYYFHHTQGYLLKGWQQIDGTWYYFREEDGLLLRNAQTPDGYLVDKNGIYVEAEGWAIRLFNKTHPVPNGYSCVLQTFQNGEQADERIYEAWAAMYEAAKQEGCSLSICSGYRSYNWQVNRYNQKVSNYQLQGYSYEEACKKTETTLAYPGTSEHQTGLALDIISPSYQSLTYGFADTKEGKWLAEHAHEYGFILRYPQDKVNITAKSFEPWHYRYVGVNAATEIWEKGICLEEYWEEHFEGELF